MCTKIIYETYEACLYPLRERGHASSGYLDYSLLVGYSYYECQTNIVDTTNLLRNLGL